MKDLFLKKHGWRPSSHNNITVSLHLSPHVSAGTCSHAWLFKRILLLWNHVSYLYSNAFILSSICPTIKILVGSNQRGSVVLERKAISQEHLWISSCYPHSGSQWSVTFIPGDPTCFLITIGGPRHKSSAQKCKKTLIPTKEINFKCNVMKTVFYNKLLWNQSTVW